jgi:aminomethyltransferase
MMDDGTLYRVAESEFWLFTAERQRDWMQDSALGFDVNVSDVSAQWAGVSLQGPTAYSVLEAAGFTTCEALKPFDFCEVLHPKWGTLLISRTGFTGDLGYEVWMAARSAVEVFDALMEKGALYGVRAIGSQALNMARIEAGYLMPKVDFQNAEHTIRRHRDATPLELGLAFAVDFKKPAFTGRRALLAQQKAGLTRALIGLELEGQKPAHHALIYADEAGLTEIGHISSALWSPTLKRNLAYALVRAPWCHTPVAQPTPLWVDFYLHRELTWERSMLKAWRVDKPFVQWPRRVACPPGRR